MKLRQSSIKYLLNLMEQQQQKVLVTGATGYIGSHVIKILLEKGYLVYGTVRDLAKKDKYAFLFNFQNAKDKLQLREADLLDTDKWNGVLAGIDYVIHVASPIPPSVPKDQDQIIKPAVEGTRNVIEACLKNKVKRIVFTSSCLTVMVRKDGKIADQNDWSDLELLHHYPKSKYLAQKLFWEYAEKNKGVMEFVSVLPSLVIGPAFSKHGNSSEALVSEILNGGFPGIPTPSTEYSIVDVRDAAQGHVRALEHKDANGKRYIISGDQLDSHTMFNLLRETYGPKGYNVTSTLIDEEGIKKSGHGPSLRTLALLGRKIKVNNSRGINELGMKYHTAKESLLEQAQAQIALGIVKKNNSE